MSDKAPQSETRKRLDRLSFALILIVNELRSNVATVNGEAVASISASTLDRVEKLILFQGEK